MQTAFVHSVRLKTNGAGSGSKTVSVRGQLIAVAVEIGDLSTPDVAITDEPTGTALLTLTGQAGSAVFYPTIADNDVDGSSGSGVASQAVFGSLQVSVTGGGANKEGIFRFLVG